MDATLHTGSDATHDGGPGAGHGADARPDGVPVAPPTRAADQDRAASGERNADLLGYFSIGLGLAELLAPHAIHKVIGVEHPDDRSLMTTRLMGVREIGAGIAVLASERREAAMWARVAGDVLDLALLGRVMANPDNDHRRTAFATANVLAVTALDWMTARQLAR